MKNTSEHPMKIQRRAFHALFIMHVMWHHLGGPSTIQWPLLNRNDSHLMCFIRVVDHGLIDDRMVTPKLAYKLRYSSPI